MTQWEYVKGSEADFENYRYDVLQIRKRRDNGLIFGSDGSVSDTDWLSDIIAERRKVDNLQSRVNDANLGDALKEMFKDVPGTKIDVPYDKYNRPCKGVSIDVYDVLVAFNVTNPALQHLIKKALAVGQRGHKDKNEDLNDILASAKRAIELEGRYK